MIKVDEAIRIAKIIEYAPSDRLPLIAEVFTQAGVNINSLGNGNYSFNVRADYGSEYSDTIDSPGISVTDSFCTHNNAKLRCIVLKMDETGG